jgi:hypothetical protein
VASAVAAGARRVDAVAVASGTAPPTPPCGMCLQTLAEFAGPDLPVTLHGARGAVVRTTLGALLPSAFTRKFLLRRAGGPGRAAGTGRPGGRPGRTPAYPRRTRPVRSRSSRPSS